MQNEIRYIDLFAGVGGFRLGIERAEICNGFREDKKGNGESETSIQSIQECNEGSRPERYSTIIDRRQKKFYCVFTSEIDKYAIQTYNKNFGTNLEPNDITTQDADSIPDFDLLCGGFPCQSFSIAGKRKGFQDTRGTMFFEIARIIKAKRPSYLLLENVKGLLNHDKGKTFSVILETLEELGYETQWMVLNSKFFGVPQNRERVFIIGNLRGTSRPEILPFGECNEEAKELVYYQKSDREIARVYDTEGVAPTLHLKTGGWQEPKININYQNNVNNIEFVPQDNRIFSDKGISPPMTTRNNQGKLIQDVKIRRLTPTECERLQGFPDGWTEGVSDTQRYKQMGNAVTVNVVQAIMSKLTLLTGVKK